MRKGKIVYYSCGDVEYYELTLEDGRVVDNLPWGL